MAKDARTVSWVEGWTQARRFRLKIDGVYPDLTDRTFELVLSDKDGAPVATPGLVAVVSPQSGATLGAIDYTPGAAILTAARSPLRAHFKETGPGGDRYWPNQNKGGPMLWYVSAPGA